MKTNKRLSVFILLGILLMATTVKAQQNTDEIEVGYLRTGQIDVEGFSLSNETTITIKGHAGLYERMGNDLMFYGWILDGQTREVVWDLLKEENDTFFRYRDRGRFSFNTEVTLPAGDYEVYYAAGIDQDNKGRNIRIEDIGDLFDWIFGNDRRERNSRRYDDFSMILSSNSGNFSRSDWRKNLDAFTETAIASIMRAGDEEFITANFIVDEDIALNIRGIGEQTDGEDFDFGWIVDSKTYEKVWPTDDTRYQKAGGGRKNKLVSETIDLPKGAYTLFYVSDDSHSYDRWNALPPYDPQFWGIAIWADERDQAKVRLSEASDSFVLKLTKAHDNDYMTQAFRLKKDMKIRVYSIGERSSSYDMVDYGWIMNADTHEKVWEFKSRNSNYAGGAIKNRVVNDEIELEEGNYIAYYLTDGSHAYRDWNDAPPLIPDLYGLSILAVDNAEYFELINTNDLNNDNLLAEIVRIRDNEYEQQSFSLSKESTIRIYAIGEGDNWDMHDTGWIKSRETGRVVWEMTYRNTEHAGGASKNKLFDGNIILPAGEYSLYFETDGSHSYRDWNAAAPHDQEHYGISVYLVK